MLHTVLKLLVGSSNDRVVKTKLKTVKKITALEPQISALSDDELRHKTLEFKQKIADGVSLDDILIEAFAVVREAAKRSIGLRHYDVQLLGGIILHEGKIAEMRTGEGKTLVATAPVYLNALTEKSVHVVTVNDYLAKRDAEWMGKVYAFLGLTTGVVVPDISDEERKQAYACDVTYITNNELGFDFLRDNLRLNLEEIVQRGHHFAIVDEVDSILIDEARTPLIISGQAEDSSALYQGVNQLIRKLDAKFVEIDEKGRSATLNESGLQHMEVELEKAGALQNGGLYDNENISLLHHLNQAVRAHFVYVKDKDYIVEDNQVIIIDEFSGRKMQGRRFGEGLHQAIEAKEGVNIAAENQTLASITFQNYFRMYDRLSGMTGTAMTEAGEFEEIYGLQTVEIPTNVALNRLDNEDEVYRTSKERDNAVVEQVKTCHDKGQPVLLGTASIEQSEHFSVLLKRQKIPHNTLNARNHEREADIIANAGVEGAVTIATNMAGRGTDIKLGGMDASDADRNVVLNAGGLYVLGTERHESRRIDNQLRGRAGRQGDAGETKFYLSLEDDLMRIFGSDRLDGFLKKMGLEQGEAITHSWVSKALEKAQKKVEGHNFEIRKQLIKYDDVTNDQRHAMFKLRKSYMTDEAILNTADDLRYQVLENIIDTAIPENTLPSQWNVETLKMESLTYLGLDMPLDDWLNEGGVDAQEVFTRIKNLSDEKINALYDIDREGVGELVRSVMVQILDQTWKDHLLRMDHLRQGIGLRAYGQKDPLNEYKADAYDLYEGFLNQAKQFTVQYLSYMHIRPLEEVEEEQRQAAQAKQLEQQRAKQAKSNVQTGPTRNGPCPCGSGKKFKHCCGKF